MAPESTNLPTHRIGTLAAGTRAESDAELVALVGAVALLGSHKAQLREDGAALP